MRRINSSKTIVVLVSALFLSSCGLFNKKYTDNKTKDITPITVKVLNVQMYCGGAMPTEEDLMEMESPTPMSNHTLYVVKTEKGQNVGEVMKVKTNNAGEFTASLDTAFYAVYPEDPATFVNLPQSEDEKVNCERMWKAQTFAVLRVRPIPNPRDLEILINEMCNPCEPPKP